MLPTTNDFIASESGDWHSHRYLPVIKATYGGLPFHINGRAVAYTTEGLGGVRADYDQVCAACAVSVEDRDDAWLDGVQMIELPEFNCQLCGLRFTEPS